MALKTFTINNGSANQALVTNGSGVLSFAAVGASAGQVIQVLTATDSTLRSTASSSFVTASNTLSVTITPSSASNKVFVIMTSNMEAENGRVTIFRDSTNLGNATNGMSQVGTSNPAAISILDSPNTTSAIVYQVRIATFGSICILQAINNALASITCFEIKG